MVAVDGVRAPAGARLRRLVRRWLVVASLALAGWVLGALFATATAEASPREAEPGHGAPPARQVTPAPESAPRDEADTDIDPGTDTDTDSEADAEADQPVDPAVDPAAWSEPLDAPPPAETVEDIPVTLLAPAQPAPRAEPVQHDRLLGGLLGGLDGPLSTLTQSVLGVLDDDAPPAPAEWAPPVQSVPEDLPEPPLDAQPEPPLATVPEPSPVDAAASPAPAPTPAARPGPAPAARPAAVTTRDSFWEHPATALPPSRRDDDRMVRRAELRERAQESPVPPQPPSKAPGAPSGAPTASTAHDTSSGARGSQGVLSAQSPPAPRTAGSLTGGNAAEATGRIAGLPATSPD